jgi:hypothetical protein
MLRSKDRQSLGDVDDHVDTNLALREKGLF